MHVEDQMVRLISVRLNVMIPVLLRGYHCQICPLSIHVQVRIEQLLFIQSATALSPCSLMNDFTYFYMVLIQKSVLNNVIYSILSILSVFE